MIRPDYQDRELWTPEEVAKYLGTSSREILRFASSRMDFPRPIRDKQIIRFMRKDIMNWKGAQKQGEGSTVSNKHVIWSKENYLKYKNSVLLRLDQVAGIFNVNRKTIMRWSRENSLFPRPIYVGPHSIRFLKDQVVEYIELYRMSCLEEEINEERRAHAVDIFQKIRWEIYERDEFKCRLCGSKKYLTLDHIIPLSKGGTNEPDNLQTLCRICNSRKSAK